MTWSAGIVSIKGWQDVFRLDSSKASAAKVIAGAVFRPSGSRIIIKKFFLSSVSCWTTKSLCITLQIISASDVFGIPSSRVKVFWNRVCLLVRERNCLGKCRRESGHSRVPVPPARITGCKDMNREPVNSCRATYTLVLVNIMDILTRF